MSLVFALVLGSAPPSVELHKSSECPRIFGSSSDQKKNAAERAPWLISVQIDDNGVEIIQHTALKEPKRLVLNGIALAPKSEDEPPTQKNEAIVLLDEELATKGECEAGLYRVEMDDNLGLDTAVIAATRSLILLQREGELWFLTHDDSDDPLFRMTWEARFRLPRPFTTSPQRPQPPTRR